MAQRGSLGSTGVTIALIGAVIAIIFATLDLINYSLELDLSFLDQINIDSGTGTVVKLILALILFLLCTGRIDIPEPIVLGILIIILGALIGGLGGLIAIIGGALVIIDILTH